MEKLIELIEKHRDKWQRKWTKGSQLRDNNSEHYDAFLHGESVGATKAYNNVLQWMKNPSIIRVVNDLALTWEDIAIILSIYEAGVDNGDYSRYGDSGKMKEYSQDVLKRFSQIKEETK